MRYGSNVCYMKKEAQMTVKVFSEELGLSHDIITRWWRQGIIKGQKKNPFARNSPILIPSTELERIKKVIKEMNGGKKSWVER